METPVHCARARGSGGDLIPSNLARAFLREQRGSSRCHRQRRSGRRDIFLFANRLRVRGFFPPVPTAHRVTRCPPRIPAGVAGVLRAAGEQTNLRLTFYLLVSSPAKMRPQKKVAATLTITRFIIDICESTPQFCSRASDCRRPAAMAIIRRSAKAQIALHSFQEEIPFFSKSAESPRKRADLSAKKA